MAILEKTKNKVHKRAKGYCEFCQSSDSHATHRFYIDHIVPQSKKGSDSPENLALICPGCNNHKYNKLTGKDPFTSLQVALFHPRKQKWVDHFTWDKFYTRIVGLTPAGRATIEVLKLNRERLVKRREAFFALGFHPPKHTMI